MQRRVLILHGWGGSDYPHWQAHLAMEIAKEYGTVSFPLIQHPHFPNKNRWLKQLREHLESFRPDTVVCHSLANTLWLHAAAEGGIAPIRRLFMVSPPSLQTSEKTLKSFFPVALPSQLYAESAHLVVSDNDPWISVDEAQRIAQTYDASFTVLPDAGHINADSGYGKWEWIERRVIDGEE